MSQTSRRRTAPVIGLICLALVFGPGCRHDVDDDDDAVVRIDEYRASNEQQLDDLVERGLEHQLPPPLSEAEQDLQEAKLERARVADDMAIDARAAMAPIAMAAAIFALDGPADLLLSVVPLDKFGDAARLVKRGLKLRRQNKRARQLIKHYDDLLGELDGETRAFVRLASKLQRGQRRALKTIDRHTSSPAVIRLLMRKQLKHDADVVWIAKRLEAGKLDGEDVRRFTFDADFVRAFTQYEANPSWKVLMDVVEGRVVPDGKRGSLASKLTGLLGERAAARMVRKRAFAAKLFGSDAFPLTVQRGVGYRGVYGRAAFHGSLDIVGLTGGDRALVGEVKNWAVGTWQLTFMRQRLFDQLEKHNAGIPLLEDVARRPTIVKVVLVSGDGFGKLGRNAKKEVEEELKRLEWAIESIPSRTIEDFGSVIDGLR